MIFKCITGYATSISKTLNTIANNNVFNKILILVSTFYSSFFLPVQFVILFVFLTMLLDMYYGIKVAIKLKRKIQSCRNWNGTIRKMRDAFLLLCSVRGVEYFLLHDISDTKVLTCGVALLISLTEIWSVLENLNTLEPNGPWRLVSKFLRKKGEEYTGVEITEDDTNNTTTSK